MPRRARTRLLIDKTGVAAVEFALVAPLLLALLLGAVELDNQITAGRRLAQASYSVAQVISEAPNPPGTINYMDLQMANDSAMVVFPLVLSDSAARGVSWGSDISITISNIVMAKVVTTCSTSCAYTAHVAWSWGASKRPCLINLSAATSDTATPTATTLPPDVFAPGSVIVADITYTYRSVFETGLFGTFVMHRSTYLQPRNVTPSSYIQYSTVSGDPGATTLCPGY